MENADYVLTWSQSQGAFHIEPMKECVFRNAEACMTNRPSD